jgi:hypothetical protein
MFYLWFGVIAGILLAYSAMRAGYKRPSENALCSWLAAAVELTLFIPIVLEFIKIEFSDGLGLLEAIKTVFIPWFAGVGFGVWIYLTAIPLRRLLRRYRRKNLIRETKGHTDYLAKIVNAHYLADSKVDGVRVTTEQAKSDGVLAAFGGSAIIRRQEPSAADSDSSATTASDAAKGTCSPCKT